VMSAIALESVRVLATHLPLMKVSPTSSKTFAGNCYGAYLAGAVLAVVGTWHSITRRATCSAVSTASDHGQMNAVVLPHALAFNESAIPRPTSA